MSEQPSQKRPSKRDEERLDRVFFALSDPIRRKILGRLDGQELLVSELAEPFSISLQAVSRHISVLEKAGLIEKERTGRISRCRLEVGPIADAAVWINHYSKYWQAQFELLGATIDEISERQVEEKKVKRAPRRVSAPRPRK